MDPAHRHPRFSRRDFLRFSAALGLGTVVGRGRGLAAAVSPGSGIQWDRQVVLIELDGGNDGLNTLVPFEDDRYYALRPQLGIPSGSLITRPELAHDGAAFGLHPALAGLMGLWDAGDLAIHQGLGYASSNRSHFRGIDIWNTGSSANQYLDSGWFGRLVDPASPPAAVVGDAVLLGRYGSNPAAKPSVRSLAMSNPRDFVEQGRDLQPVDANTGNPSLDHILRIQNRVQAAIDTIDAAVPQLPDPATPGDYLVDPRPFPDSDLGEQLHATAEMIASGLCFPLYKVSYRGFDTHARQADVHAALLADLGQCLAAFRGALGSDQWNRTLVVTYSEFGRRCYQNGSLGTDHGSAAPHLLCGGAISGGLYGANPDLSPAALDANDGDVGWSDDFRRLYATAGAFLGFEASEIQTALGASYAPLPCLT